MNRIRIHFDGACHNIKKESSDMGVGIAVFIDDELSEEFSQALFVKPILVRGTSNIAEWEGCKNAMILAVELRAKFPDSKIEVYSDSEIITNQFNGRFQINKPEFLDYFRQARYFASKAGVEQVNWIPRERNKVADVLSKCGLKDLDKNEKADEYTSDLQAHNNKHKKKSKSKRSKDFTGR